MSRIRDIERQLGRLEERVEEKDTTKKKKKSFFPKIIKKFSRRADKDIETVMVQYLTVKQQVVFKLCKIVSGNLVVINNKVHVLNPKKIWRHKKQMWYIIREIDRIPISNEDYDKVKERKDDTEADVPLIKAVHGAIQKPATLGGRNLWIFIILGIIALVVLFTFMG